MEAGGSSLVQTYEPHYEGSSNVFEMLGAGFTLLAFGVKDTVVHVFEQAATSLDILLNLVRDTYDDGRKAYKSRLILVRPDQYYDSRQRR